MFVGRGLAQVPTGLAEAYSNTCRPIADTARPREALPGGAGSGAVRDAPSARKPASRRTGTSGSSSPYRQRMTVNRASFLKCCSRWFASLSL